MAIRIGLFVARAIGLHVGTGQRTFGLTVGIANYGYLPIPIMDGGHFVLLMAEKIRGKAVSAKIQEKLAWVGLAIILSIFVFVTFNDIKRFLL